MRKILFLVDTKSLGEQAESEFCAYKLNDDNRKFINIYGLCRLRNSYIPDDVQVCISTIQRMDSILKGEELDESAEEESLFEQSSDTVQAIREVGYNEKYPPEIGYARWIKMEKRYSYIIEVNGRFEKFGLGR